MVLCYLGLGSNLKSPSRQLSRAVNSLRKLPQTQLVQSSKLYLSHPLGVRAQPSYLNQVILLQTTLSPLKLLQACQSIEAQQQRIRKQRWGARTIDIDILLYDSKIIHLKNLQIPHPEMHKRDFVLLPLLEIAPDLHLPQGKALSCYLDDCCHSVKTTWI